MRHKVLISCCPARDAPAGHFIVDRGKRSAAPVWGQAQTCGLKGHLNGLLACLPWPDRLSFIEVLLQSTGGWSVTFPRAALRLPWATVKSPRWGDSVRGCPRPYIRKRLRRKARNAYYPFPNVERLFSKGFLKSCQDFPKGALIVFQLDALRSKTPAMSSGNNKKLLDVCRHVTFLSCTHVSRQ